MNTNSALMRSKFMEESSRKITLEKADFSFTFDFTVEEKMYLVKEVVQAYLEAKKTNCTNFVSFCNSFSSYVGTSFTAKEAVKCKKDIFKENVKEFFTDLMTTLARDIEVPNDFEDWVDQTTDEISNICTKTDLRPVFQLCWFCYRYISNKEQE